MSDCDDVVDDADAGLEHEPSDDGERHEARWATADDAANARLRADRMTENDRSEWSTEFVPDVDAQRLVIRDVDPGFQSTVHGYSRAEVGQMIEDLEEVQRRKNAGYTDSDFERMRESTDAIEHRLGNTEHCFYSRDSGVAVKVEWNGTDWEVSKGRHRALIAQERGMPSMPAFVSAPEQSMISGSRRSQP